MEKLERDGKVAVVYSPGYGAGWSTWNYREGQAEIMAMDKDIAEAVLAGDLNKAVALADEKCGKNGEHVCTLGAGRLCVEWVPKGEAFEITEYDGSESVVVIGEQKYMIA
jgi:hypothetical protein